MNAAIPDQPGGISGRAVGTRGRLRGVLALGLLALLLLTVASTVVVGPSVVLGRERKKRQQAAEDYVRSLGLPLYPNMAVVDHLLTSEREHGGVRVSLTRAAFHAADGFDAVRTMYARGLSPPLWRQSESSTGGIGRNWQAERTVGATTTTVRVSAPSREGFVAVTYSIVTTTKRAAPSSSRGVKRQQE